MAHPGRFEPVRFHEEQYAPLAFLRCHLAAGRIPASLAAPPSDLILGPGVPPDDVAAALAYAAAVPTVHLGLEADVAALANAELRDYRSRMTEASELVPILSEKPPAAAPPPAPAPAPLPAPAPAAVGAATRPSPAAGGRGLPLPAPAPAPAPGAGMYSTLPMPAPAPAPAPAPVAVPPPIIAGPGRDHLSTRPLEPTTWTCPTCTFQNVLARGKCEMCDGDKPRVNNSSPIPFLPPGHPAPAPGVGGGVPATWSCAVCTYANHAARSNCDICGSSKPHTGV
jgi:hypothetical protein